MLSNTISLPNRIVWFHVVIVAAAVVVVDMIVMLRFSSSAEETIIKRPKNNVTFRLAEFDILPHSGR